MLSIISKNKKDIFVLCVLLFFLIIPRIAVYYIFGTGIVGTDAEYRYIPQMQKLSESLANFFQETGPAYSLFLLLFKKLNIDTLAGPVFVQHILGIISAMMVFYYLKRVNFSLAFIVTILTFCGWMALWLEHTILREALASFLLILLVVLVSFMVKNKKYFRFYFGFLSGLIGLTLVLLRIEFLALFILIPFILFFLKNKYNSDFNVKNSIKWAGAYFFPAFILCFLYLGVFHQPKVGVDYNSFFSIVYYNLDKNAFRYQGSAHQELLEEYQTLLEVNNGDFKKIGGMFPGVTKEYLSQHPEIKISSSKLMDKMYVEMMTKNTGIYLKSFIVNLKNQLIGVAELDTLVHKDKLSEMSDSKLSDNSLAGKIFRLYNLGMIWFSTILFWVFLLSLPFLIIRWNNLPMEVIFAFFLSAIQIFVLTFLANPAHRFRYSFDPFLYFLQFYLALILFQSLIRKIKSIRIFDKQN